MRPLPQGHRHRPCANLYADAEQLEWLEGESLTARFDLPAARSFATTFCTRCGSPLPHLTRSGRTVVVPAGSVDSRIELAVEGRIFFDDATSWSCGADRLPVFAAYPDWWG